MGTLTYDIHVALFVVVVVAELWDFIHGNPTHLPSMCSILMSFRMADNRVWEALRDHFVNVAGSVVLMLLTLAFLST